MGKAVKSRSEYMNEYMREYRKRKKQSLQENIENTKVIENIEDIEVNTRDTQDKLSDNPNKKYFWLKLKTSFFHEKVIKKLRKMDKGDTYTIIYLKMQLNSLQNNGILLFEGVEDSFEEELALELDEEVENVRETVNYLKYNKLLEILSDNEILLTEVPNIVGTETYKAESMRKLRKKRSLSKQSSNNVTKVLPNVTDCYIEKDIEKEKEIDIDIYNNNNNDNIKIRENNTRNKKCQEKNYEKSKNFMKFYLNNVNPTASSYELEKIASWEDDMEPRLIIKAMEIAVENNVRRYSYINSILNNWLNQNIKTYDQLINTEKLTTTKQSQTKNKFINYEQNNYDFKKLRELELERLKKRAVEN